MRRLQNVSEDTEIMKLEELSACYRGRRVLVTGHTGFKGSWLCAILALLGAQVYGYSKEPPTDPSLFETLFGAGAGKQTAENLRMRLSPEDEKRFGGPFALSASYIGDIRDYETLLQVYQKVQPEFVFHLAAQPIVRDSYRMPRETYETNVMGTVNLLECLRLTDCCRSFLNVTTDKVYLNEERPGYGYREEDKLDGYDPYSNSKSCSELATHSYMHSFFSDEAWRAGSKKEGANRNAACVKREGKLPPAISTARAGNVIGGGDMANDRIIPDCIRAAQRGEVITVRNPDSTRPYQHVLEPLAVYLTIAMRQEKERTLSGWYNVGPDDCDCVTTGELADLFVKYWGNSLSWTHPEGGCGPHEANFLKLSNQKIKRVFGWKPVWHIDRAVLETVLWTKAAMQSDEAANGALLRQIADYFS